MGYEWLNPAHDLDGIDFSDSFDGSLRDIIRREYMKSSPNVMRSILRGGAAGAVAGYIAQAFDLPPDTMFLGGAIGAALDVAQYKIRYEIEAVREFLK